MDQTEIPASGTEAVLGRAKAALAHNDWSAAVAHLEPATFTEPLLEAERLELLGEARWWLGQIDACIEARERAYALFDAAGATRRSGQMAIWLFEHHVFKGSPAIGSGWLRRARRALELAGDEDCIEWGNLLLREAEVSHGAGERKHALDNGTIALDLGRRLRSTDLEAEALQTIGRVLIDDGRAREGLAHLDEAMLFAVEGRLGPYATGKVYCSLVGACEDLGDLRRAAEWTDATMRWSEQHPFAVFPGLCRVKRAGVLQWQGDWEQAEREARRACDELAHVKVASAGTAWVEVGEIRRRLGDLAGAEEAFARAQELSVTPTSGLALLRLAQGRLDAAVALIASALGDDTRSRLARGHVLPAAVQVAIAADDLAAASQAADELDALAVHYDTPALVANATLARGRVQLAAGNPSAACASLRRAVEQWQALEVPYEAATAQLLLGQACREGGDRDGEVAAFASATDTFTRLGAAHEIDRARALTDPRALPCGLTEREAEVLRLVAEGRTNKEIAAHLVLSEKTIARHLSNIFAKTGVATRTAAAAFAYDQGIVGSHR